MSRSHNQFDNVPDTQIDPGWSSAFDDFDFVTPVQATLTELPPPSSDDVKATMSRIFGEVLPGQTPVTATGAESSEAGGKKGGKTGSKGTTGGTSPNNEGKGTKSGHTKPRTPEVKDHPPREPPHSIFPQPKPSRDVKDKEKEKDKREKNKTKESRETEPRQSMFRDEPDEDSDILTESQALAMFGEKCKAIGLIPREQWKVAISKRCHDEKVFMDESEINAIIFGMNIFRNYNSISETHEMVNTLFGELEAIRVTSKELRDTNENLKKIVDANAGTIKKGIFDGVQRVIETIKKGPEEPKPAKPPKSTRTVRSNAPVKIRSPRRELSPEVSDSSAAESDVDDDWQHNEQAYQRKADSFLAGIGVTEYDRQEPLIFIALKKCVDDETIIRFFEKVMDLEEKDLIFDRVRSTAQRLLKKEKKYKTTSHSTSVSADDDGYAI